MKYFAHPVTICLLVLAMASGEQVWAESTEIEAGVVYPGETTLRSSEIGLEFSVPRGWQAILPIGGNVLHMEADNADAQLLVSAVSNTNETQLIRLLKLSQPLDVSTRLIASGTAGKQGRLYRQHYTISGLNTKNLAAEAYAVVGDNQVAFIAIGVEAGDNSGAATRAKELVKTVNFIAPTQARTDDECFAKIDWNRLLGGHMLIYTHTVDAKSTKRRLELCANHRFRLKESENYLAGDKHTEFSATAHNRKSGRWQISGDQLMLSWSDGKRSSHTLSRHDETEDESGILLDDEFWTVLANQACY